MRARRTLISLLLVTAVLAGQTLAGVHDADHGLQAGAAHACAVCVYAHGAGTGALPAVPHIAFDPASTIPEAPAAASPLAAILRHHPIRGPPAFLA